MKRIILQVVVVSLLVVACNARSSDKYKVDFAGARELVYGTFTNSLDEVRVCVSTARKDFDSYTKVSKLMDQPSAYQTTNAAVISDVITKLRQTSDDAGSITSTGTIGRTCHLLLISNKESSVLHFRIFLPEKGSGSQVLIYPRSDTEFGYVNSEILPWLQSVGIGTGATETGH